MMQALAEQHFQLAHSIKVHQTRVKINEITSVTLTLNR